jgi:hypothetical protein
MDMGVDDTRTSFPGGAISGHPGYPCKAAQGRFWGDTMIAVALVTAALAVATGTPADPAADPLVALHGLLSGLLAKEPVRVRFHHQLERRQGEGRDAKTWKGTVQGQAAIGPDGLHLSWGSAVLEQLLREAKRHATDGEAPEPTTDAVAELDAVGLAKRLDAAAEIRLALEQAKLLEERTDLLEGAPCRLLVLQVEPALSARDRKYVKKLDATVRLWLGPDGLPLAAEQRVKVSGRAMLVITFESEELERFRFLKAGDRLLAVRHERQRKADGAGEHSERSSVTTFDLIR